MKSFTPKETIRRYCVYCNGGNAREVESCDADGNDPLFRACPFHPYRMGKGRPSVKLIRQFCLQCMGDSTLLVRKCETADCLCHPYRMSQNPNRIGKGHFAKRMAENNVKKQALNEGFSAYFERSSTRQ